MGVKAKKTLVENLSVSYGAYVGYGIAAMKYCYTETYYSSSVSETIDYTGGCAIVDLTAGFDYMLAENISIGAHCGYMIANVNEVTSQKNSTVLAVKKGDTFKDSSGTAIPLDFSGLSIAGSLNIKF